MQVKKGSISEVLLLALEQAVEGALLLNEFSYSSQLRALKGLPPRKQDLALIMAVRRLRTKGLIEAEKVQDGKTILRLTYLGQDFLREQKDHAWDGIYRIVAWDIPERKRTIRNLLRRRLKDWGFVGWQKSVWVSKRNVTVQLRSLIMELGIEKWVSVIESDDSSLERIFI